MIGGFIGRCLTPAVQRRERVPRPALAGRGVAAVGAIAFLIPVDTGPDVRATFDLNVRNSSDGRVATGTFRLDPPDAANDAYWFNVTSWQGKDGPAQIDKPERIGPRPLPDHPADPRRRDLEDDLRLHKGRQLAGLPIFMPADPAIPVLRGAGRGPR